MPVLPGSLFPGFFQQFTLNDDGLVVPLSGGKVYWYVAGTSTPKDTFNDADLDPLNVNANPVVLDANGRAIIFLEPGGYKAVVKDADDVELFTRDDIEDIGLTFFNQLGTELATGDTSAVSGDTLTASQNLIVVTDASGDDPATFNLLPADERSFPVTIKNATAVELQINANGSDTIEGSLSSYTLPAAATPEFPSVILWPDTVSSWWIAGGHKT